MKAILILGAGVMQGPVIQLARQKGYRVCVADGNDKAVHAKDADEFVHVDLKDKEALAAAAAGLPGLAGVMTAGTDFSASVAWVAEKLGLPGIPHETALDASDKARMRTRLAAAGVPVPSFAYGTIDDDPEKLAAGFVPGGLPVYPVVVKPVDNMGARGCRLVRKASELATAWKDAVSHSRSGRAIIEEYLDGPEFSLDAIVHSGTIHIRGIADRHIHFEPYFIEMGHTMPTAYGPEIVEAVVEVFKSGIRALGINRGAAKGDIKYTRKGAFVGEIAARLSGGYMSGWTYPHSSGIEPSAEAIDIACGVVPAEASPLRDWVCAERAFISIPGKVQEIRNLESAADIPGVTELFSRITPGDTVRFPVNNVEKCGNVIAAGPDRAQVESSAATAARSVLIRLQPGEPSTAAFLNMNGRSDQGLDEDWPPYAYGGISAMVLACMESMPDVFREKKPVASISIAPLQGINSEAVLDWQGRTVEQGLAAVQELTGVTIGLDGDLVL
ncbi:MAG: ATP-grasp domain-containing protein, partial [Spirochaetia bacterium]|nr:ATP-grasp domain-containing protein [Spirochaetia bacterium]